MAIAGLSCGLFHSLYIDASFSAKANLPFDAIQIVILIIESKMPCLTLFLPDPKDALKAALAQDRGTALL